MEKQLEEIAMNLATCMNSMMKIKDQLFAQVPDEHMDKIIPIQQDINKAIESIKAGDMTKINEITEKYARYSNK